MAVVAGVRQDGADVAVELDGCWRLARLNEVRLTQGGDAKDNEESTTAQQTVARHRPLIDGNQGLPCAAAARAGGDLRYEALRYPTSGRKVSGFWGVQSSAER